MTDQDLAVLDFERRWWRFPGAKAAAIRDQFDCTEAVYYQRLNVLLDSPDAHAHDPQLVSRLRRLREARRRWRQPA